MKKLFLLISLVLLTSCATHTSFNTFYKNNHHESDFSLGINSSLIRGFLPDEDFEDVKPLLKKAKHIRILVFSENTEDDNDKINFFILENKDKIKEVVLQISSDGDLVLLGLKTNLTQEDIDKLFNDNDITFN